MGAHERTALTVEAADGRTPDQQTAQSCQAIIAAQTNQSTTQSQSSSGQSGSGSSGQSGGDRTALAHQYLGSQASVTGSSDAGYTVQTNLSTSQLQAISAKVDQLCQALNAIGTGATPDLSTVEAKDGTSFKNCGD